MLRKTNIQTSPGFSLVAIAVFFLMVILLSACGGQESPAGNAPAPVNSSMNDVTSSNNADQPEISDSDSEPEAAPTETAAEPTEASVAEPQAADGVSFAAEVFPIIDSRCVNCHGGERVEGDLILRSYADLMAGSESGQVIVPGDAENSLLVQLISELKMPKRGPKLTPVQIQLITDWVNQGALDN